MKLQASLGSRGGEITRRVPCRLSAHGEPRAKFRSEDFTCGGVAEFMVVWTACCGEPVLVRRLNKIVVSDHGEVQGFRVPIFSMSRCDDAAEC